MLSWERKAASARDTTKWKTSRLTKTSPLPLRQHHPRHRPHPRLQNGRNRTHRVRGTSKSQRNPKRPKRPRRWRNQRRVKLHEIVFFSWQPFYIIQKPRAGKVSTIKKRFVCKSFLFQLLFFMSRSVQEPFVGSFFIELGYARPF